MKQEFLLFSPWLLESPVNLLVFIHMGGCQNYGPFLGPYYITAPNP